MPFGVLGLGMSATKYFAQYRNSDKEKVGKIIGLTSLITTVTNAIIVILLFVCFTWLESNTIAAPHLSST